MIDPLISTIGGTTFAIVIAWMVLKEYFKSARAARESDKASRITIDNHIDHFTKIMIQHTATMSDILERGEEDRIDRKEARRDLQKALQENTAASTKQSMTNENVEKALDELTKVVREKL